MAILKLFSTGPHSNPAARPFRRADTGAMGADIVAWYTTVEVPLAGLTPLAAWLATNVRSTLRSGTAVRLTSSEMQSEIMRREGMPATAVDRHVAAFGDEPAVLDWRFSQYDPRTHTPEQWLEREARRILALRPRRIAVISWGRTQIEFDMSQVSA